jgi:hypothetical protein
MIVDKYGNYDYDYYDYDLSEGGSTILHAIKPEDRKKYKRK